MSRWRHRLPFVAALAAYGLAVALIAYLSFRAAGGRLLYTFDDAWIQLAVAKNLAQHGVFGVTRHAFTAASSSPLWCLLLAAVFTVAGARQIAALALNVAAGGGALAVAAWILARHRVPPPAVLGVLAMVVAAAPLHTLPFVGLEHSLHTLLHLAFLYLAAEELSSAPLERRPPAYLLPVLAALLVGTRYEGLFAVSLVAGCALLRRRVGRALTVLGAGLAPVVAFGLLSVGRGWNFLPNSVLLKAGLLETGFARMLVPFRAQDYDDLLKHPELLCLILAGALVSLRGGQRDRTPWRSPTLFLLFATLSLLAQVRYGVVGPFFRYEVYAVAACLLALGVALFADGEGRGRWRSRHPAVGVVGAAAVVFMLVPFAARARTATRAAVYGGRDRLVQQVLPAQFVAAHYPRSTVVLNDIGAVAFYSDARILDLVGLGSMEPLRLARQPGGLSRQSVEAWARDAGAELAILLVPWPKIEAITPDSWVEVARVFLARDAVYRHVRNRPQVRLYACRGEGPARLLQQRVRRFLAPRYRRLGVRVVLRRLDQEPTTRPPTGPRREG